MLQTFSTSKDEHGAKGNAERVQPNTRNARCDRVHQEKFNSQFLAWTARQTLSDLLYRISKILSTFEKCFVSDAHVVHHTYVPLTVAQGARVLQVMKLSGVVFFFLNESAEELQRGATRQRDEELPRG